MKILISPRVLAPSPVGEGWGEGKEKVLNEKIYLI